MKKTLIKLLCTLTTVSSALADVTIVQESFDIALIQNQQNFTLSEVKEKLMESMPQHGGLLFLAFDNVEFSVNESTIAQIYSDAGEGGPLGVAFTGNVSLNFNTPLSFEDDMVGFMLGFDLASTGHTNSHLSINLQNSFLNGIEWGKDELSNMYYYTFFKCQYFNNSGSPLDFDVRINGRGIGATIDGYEYVGYVQDPSKVQNGQIAVIPVSSESEGWDGLMPGWSGQALSLVAKPQVGRDAPDLVPEPTTGTLSLLALAALAARRRKK